MCATSDGSLWFVQTPTWRYCGQFRFPENLNLDVRWIHLVNYNDEIFIFVLDARSRLTIWKVAVTSFGKLE